MSENILTVCRLADDWPSEGAYDGQTGEKRGGECEEVVNRHMDINK